MSSTQGFSFPPPPPPPPKQQQQQQPQQNAPSHGQSYNGHRGGRGRGRGRGFGHRGGGRGGGNHAATQSTPSSSVGYAPMNYTGYPAQSTPGVSAPQYGVAPNYPPSTTFPNQNFQQGYNGMYNQTGGQMPPYQNQPSAAQSMMGMPMPWGYGQAAATGMHPGVPSGNGWNPQQFSNNGYGNQVANGGNPMTQQQHANKRDHTSAFGKPHSTAPRVPAPPAVPSFGNPLPSKPPPPSETTRAPKKKKRQHNQLGLTPKTEDHESSEEEEGVDEESKFAAQSDGPGGISAPLKFTYRGRTATLQTPEDIAKWIEERKKRFPTQARVEEKKKAMEEAKKAREEALKQKRESRKEETKRTHKDSRGSDQQKASNDPVDAATKAAQKAEKLRQKLLREQKRVAKAEAEAKRAQAKVEALQKESAGEKTGEGSTDAAEISSPADMSGDSDWTSSSGSDDSSSGSDSDSEGSDDDSAPEEMTSRRDGPERVPPPPRENVKKRICRHFARNGRCLRGDSCNFLHELPDRKTKNKPAAPQKGRQGLLQMLLDRQERDDSQRVMEAIMVLGEQGVLDEPNHPNPEVSPRQ